MKTALWGGLFGGLAALSVLAGLYDFWWVPPLTVAGILVALCCLPAWPTQMVGGTGPPKQSDSMLGSLLSANDARICAVASDPTPRTTAIKDLTWRRGVILWLACLATIVFLLALCFATEPRALRPPFGILIAWVAFIAADQQLKRLRVAERISLDSNGFAEPSDAAATP